MGKNLEIKPEGLANTVTFSIVIPAYNASKTLSQCLESLVKQTDKFKNFEIIVVDDGSTDETPQIVKGFQGVKLISQQNQGPAVARNKGAEEAEGDIIIFIDSDCVAFPNWIEEMLKPFKKDPEVAGVKGAYKTRQNELAARFVQYEYEDKYDKMKKDKYIDFIDTYSAAFKREVFLEMGGYDTEFPVACAEDAEFSYRLSKKGHKMVFNPHALVYHIHPSSLFAYLKKKYKFAFWRMLAVKKNPDKILSDSHTPQIMKVQMLMSPLIFASIVLSIPFSKYMANFSTGLLLLFLLISLPFTIKTMKKDVLVGLLSPFFLFLRGIAQFIGVGGGFYKVVVKKDRA